MRKMLLSNLVENINLHICAKFRGGRTLRGRDQRGGGQISPPPRAMQFQNSPG